MVKTLQKKILKGLKFFNFKSLKTKFLSLKISIFKSLNISRKNKKLFNILFFIGKLLIFSIPLYVVIWFNIDLYLYQNILASQIHWILKLIGISVGRTGIELLTKKTLFVISKDCTGWKSLLFFTALIISTPSKIKKKTSGLMFGLPVLYLANIFRIIVLILLGIFYGEGYFNLVHDIFWQLFSIGSVLFLWILWMKPFTNFINKEI